jgi:mannose-6-phosphate isomerase-like protein (cupin superfamily)
MLTLIVLAAALQQAPAPTTGTPARPPATAPARRTTAAPSTVEVRVTDRTGKPAPGAHVVAEGPSARDGMTDLTGAIVFRSMTAGTYRVRAEGEGFIALEKEVTVRGTVPPIEFSLSAAPPAPVVEPPAPPPPVAEMPKAVPGEPRIVSLLDVAEDSLSGKEPVRTVPVGCSGFTRSQLLVVRETLPAESRDDADDMLYVIAGEGSITMAGKTQNITSGWFSLVPRGTSRTLARRGRNPMILLSIVGGPACAPGAAAQ